MMRLFDTLVKPILLYGSEIWAHEGTELLEKLNLRFCKYILLVNTTTYSDMVYVEIGEYPIRPNKIMFWANISQDTEKPKISNFMYKLSYKLNKDNMYKSPWLNCAKTVFN